MTATAHPELPVKETLFRGLAAEVDAEMVQVDKSGGKHEAGIIRGVSLIASGEALGHEMWIDDETLTQVAELAKRGKHGVKSRFTHPSMSADGLGRHLGRIHDVQMTEGGRVIGDLHFSEAAHQTPEGDLASYVMSLAIEDPSAAGLSIVFEHDPKAEIEFMLEHGASIDGNFVDTSAFQSPDPENANNYPHVRLSKLRAADVVDEPAANPEGMFDRQGIARDADEFLSYVAGVTEDKPKKSMFGVEADRAAQFFTRWLESHGLSLVSKTEVVEMASQETNTPEPATPSVTRESLLAEQNKYVERFGSEDGVKWFSEGKDYTEALELFCNSQTDRIAELETELAEAQERFESLSIGEDEPVDTKPDEAAGKKGFASRINVVGSKPSAN